MALFGEMTKYKQEYKPNYKNYYSNNNDSKIELIYEAIAEAKVQGLKEKCMVTLLNGDLAQLINFNTHPTLAYNGHYDNTPKVCRVYYKKGDTWMYESVDHNDLTIS